MMDLSSPRLNTRSSYHRLLIQTLPLHSASLFVSSSPIGPFPLGNGLWERPLDSVRDRLVLITGPGSSLPIRAHLPIVLDRLRDLVQGQPLDDAAVNQDERRALSVV